MSRLERLIAGNLAESDVVEESGDFVLIEGITCSDGVSLSVQANGMAYCSPRNTCGPYGAVEVGYPRDKHDNPMNMPATWDDYAERMFIEVDEENDDAEERAWKYAQIERLASRVGGSYQSSSGFYLTGVWAWVPVELVQAFVADHGGEVE